MGRIVKIASIQEVPPNGAIAVEHENEYIAVFNVDGTLYAISDVCPHAGGPLSQGEVENGKVYCPWHGRSFHLNSALGDGDGVYRYKVIVEGDDISVEIPD